MAEAAPMVWPIIDFMDDTGIDFALSPNTALMISVSVLSFSSVPVPWALM